MRRIIQTGRNMVHTTESDWREQLRDSDLEIFKAAVIPTALLLALAGLALVEVLRNSLERIRKGSLLLGPLFTFAIAFSDISLLGFGSFFWALVICTVVSLARKRRITGVAQLAEVTKLC